MGKQHDEDERAAAGVGAALVHGLTRSSVGLQALASFNGEQRAAAARLVRANDEYQREGR